MYVLNVNVLRKKTHNTYILIIFLRKFINRITCAKLTWVQVTLHLSTIIIV